MARVSKKECTVTIDGAGPEVAIEIAEVPGLGTMVSHPGLPEGVYTVSSVLHDYHNEAACGSDYLTCKIRLGLNKCDS
jgi:hypothetical protein